MSAFRGIAFPFRKGNTSLPQAAEGDDLIKDSIRQILLTNRGERVMRPDFGTGVFSFVFENNDEVLASLLESDIRTALARYEPRIDVRDVRSGSEENKILVEVFYLVKSTGAEDKVVLGVGTP